MAMTQLFASLSVICLLQLITLASCAGGGGAGVMRFTFGDNDGLGPAHWKRNKEKKVEVETRRGRGMKGAVKGRSLEMEMEMEKHEQDSGASSKGGGHWYERNRCKNHWLSPINIIRRSVTSPDLDKAAADSAASIRKLSGVDFPETLIISASDRDLAKATWKLDHPPDDMYHGIEIRTTHAGVLNVMDHFDPLGKDPFTSFDFLFLTLYYCDLGKASPRRSMHQIDGKRYPLELHFVFLRSIADDVKEESEGGFKDEDDEMTGDPSVELIHGDSHAVIVVVQGEVGPTQNRYFQPVVEAAQKFQGRDFGAGEADGPTEVLIKSPFSITWLLPDNSNYYYYDHGSFPVPPCWKVTRYYILTETIKISKDQLNALTNIQTEREKSSGNKMPCTFSLLQNEILSGEVSISALDYQFLGNDEKPRTPEETKAWKERNEKMLEFRRRMEGQVVILGNGGGGALMNKISSYLPVHLVLILMTWII